MDHREIEERDVIERYLQGTLPPAQLELFEEHLMECAECFEKVRWSEDLGEAFRTVAAEEAARATATVGMLAWLTRTSRLRRMGLLLTAAFAAVLLPYLLLQRDPKPQDPGRVETAPDPRVAELQSELAAARRRIDDERRRHEAQIGAERQTRERLAEENRQLQAPRINTPVFPLSASRGEEDEPVARVVLDPTAEWVVLIFELAIAEHPSYRVRLTRSGRTLWTGDGLKPDPTQTLSISLPTSLLPPGDYILHLEGLVPGGKPAPAGDFPFRVSR